MSAARKTGVGAGIYEGQRDVMRHPRLVAKRPHMTLE
jgi:hypothetical protein